MNKRFRFPARNGRLRSEFGRQRTMLTEQTFEYDELTVLANSDGVAFRPCQSVDSVVVGRHPLLPEYDFDANRGLGVRIPRDPALLRAIAGHLEALAAESECAAARRNGAARAELALTVASNPVPAL